MAERGAGNRGRGGGRKKEEEEDRSEEEVRRRRRRRRRRDQATQDQATHETKQTPDQGHTGPSNTQDQATQDQAGRERNDQKLKTDKIHNIDRQLKIIDGKAIVYESIEDGAKIPIENSVGLSKSRRKTRVRRDQNIHPYISPCITHAMVESFIVTKCRGPRNMVKILWQNGL